MSGSARDPALDAESRVGEIIAILSVASVLSTLVVVLRIYCRAFMLRSFGWDDGLILPAQVLALASAVAIGLEAKYGLGRHVWMMPDEDYIPYMKSFYSSIVFYNVAVCLTKISILLQYRRIFSNTILRHIIFYGLCFLTCWGITLSVLLPLVCVPTAAFWDNSVDGFCLDNATIWYVMAGVNVVTDFAIFTMPIPVISSLHLPTRQKAMLLIVFTLGVFPCAVSIYRIRTLAAAAKSTDPTWDNVDAATFSFLELTVGITAICLPTLRPVLVSAMPRIFGSILNSTGQSGNMPGTGGRNSHTPFTGQDASSHAARVSTYRGGNPTLKSVRESDSTEGLRFPTAPASREDPDVEFGELESASRGHTRGRYSVSVVAAGGETEKQPQAGHGGKAGIQTMTVVTQRVSFAGIDEENYGRTFDKTNL
ncbi:hypothetical protein MMYC01_209508 [Madurella mycetomatis]|uniref:Rhodopsin domain-containing protein n=1 Tax=Madurella mycetomatis TaxID=100816 RepID=A0A175VQM3_9PEZI|nr:hypothetical protein MMYC01_209973 [Madurella mycetomatis]KXX73693.1 hypothetical protein MMYC01_209508 [Madurella mycetomatis]